MKPYKIEWRDKVGKITMTKNMGLSPVVAAIILIVVTVALSVVIAIWMESFVVYDEGFDEVRYLDTYIIMIEKTLKPNNHDFETTLYFEGGKGLGAYSENDNSTLCFTFSENETVHLTFQGNYELNLGWKYRIFFEYEDFEIGKITKVEVLSEEFEHYEPIQYTFSGWALPFEWSVYMSR